MAGNDIVDSISVNDLIDVSELTLCQLGGCTEQSQAKVVSLASLANSMLAIAKILNNVFSTEPANTSAKE